MHLEVAVLINIRNFKEEQLDFKPGVNVVLGKNAQGKTNLLESIYFSCIGKLFRSSRLKDFIRFKEDSYQLKLQFVKDDGKKELFSFMGTAKENKMKINNIEVERRSDLFGRFPMILFSPDHLMMIKEGPSERRQFLDRELSLLSKRYFHHLVQYNKTLSQRAAHLKNGGEDSLLDVYDAQLVSYGLPLLEMRRAFLEELEVGAKKAHGHIAPKEELRLSYESSIDEKENYLDQLKSQRERDKHYGNTSIGVHLDDIKVEINGLDVRRFGSQGQVRLSALSMFLGLIGISEKRLEEKPMILLDDVFSELDRERRENIISLLQGYQSIMTTTDLDNIDSREISHRLYIKNGRLTGEEYE